MSYMSDAVSEAFTSLTELAGEDLVYSRDDDSGNMTGVPGDTRMDVANEEGTLVEIKQRDFMIRKDELVLDTAGKVEPQRGDRIAQTIGGVTFTYEVIALAGNRPWAWWDKGQTVYRIHTQQIQVGAA